REFDRSVDDWVEGHRSPALDRVFYGLSSAGDHSLLWVAIGSVREVVGWGRPGSALRLTGFLAAESAFTNGPLKSMFRRVRPDLDPTLTEGPLPYGLRRPVTSAFPSGHATSAFAAAAFLAKGDPLGPAYHVLAAAVAASRVYVRLHHASDVVAGAALGLAFGRVARLLAPSAGNSRPDA
ncbi:MAG: phosphatase PAP2 family protein, partial [Acidimicrobiia bacterium]